MAEAEHAGLLLAAGQSLRLGQPKALLSRDGEPLLLRALRLLGETGAEPRVVVIGAALREQRARLLELGALVVLNEAPQRGRLHSLQLALPLLRARPRVLLCVVDQPALSLVHLQALLQQAGGGAAVSDYGDVLGPPALWPTAWLAGLPAEGDAGLSRLLQRGEGGAIARVAAPELGFDIDTPQQLAQARARGWLDPG